MIDARGVELVAITPDIDDLDGTLGETRREWFEIHRRLKKAIWDTKRRHPQAHYQSPYIGRTPRIRHYREAIGLTQTELALAIGMDHSGVSFYETAARYPSEATATRFAEFFGVKPDDLYEPDESEHAA